MNSEKAAAAAAAAAAFAAAEVASRNAADADRIDVDDDPNSYDIMGFESNLMGESNDGSGDAITDLSRLRQQLGYSTAQITDGVSGVNGHDDSIGSSGNSSDMDMSLLSGSGIHSLLLQQMAAERNTLLQHQELQEQITMAAAAAEAARAIALRPTEHFITMAQNGTILGVTETVTGFPPDSLLMKNSLDYIHDEDVEGYKNVKSRFWDKDVPGMDIFFRRRSLEEKWIWMVGNVVSYIHEPVPGYIVHECVAKDPKHAANIAKLTKIIVKLINAIEDSMSRKEYEENEDCSSDSPEHFESKPLQSVIPGVADDVAVLQSLLASNNHDSTCLSHLRQLMEAAGMRGVKAGNHEHKDDCTCSEQSDKSCSSILSEVRAGACLDLHKIELSQAEIKLITLIVTGRLNIQDLPELIVLGIKSGKDIWGSLEQYQTEREWQILADELTASRSRTNKKTYRRSTFDSPTLSIHSDRAMKSSRIKKSHFNIADHSMSQTFQQNQSLPPPKAPQNPAPPLSVLNISYTNIGNQGLEMLCEVLHVDSPHLRTLDLGFCGIEERGFLAFSRAIRRRKNNGLPSLRGLILSGNVVSYRSAKELGLALSSAPDKKQRFRKNTRKKDPGTGYEEDDEFEYDDDDEDDVFFGNLKPRNKRKIESKSVASKSTKTVNDKPNDGLALLHLACASLTPDSLYQLLAGLGQDCPLRELSIPLNNIGTAGTDSLVSFLEKKNELVMPRLDRLDLSNNNLGDDGAARLTRAIAKRVNANANIVNMKLTCNGIGPKGIETIMNKLLQHNIVSLSLDNNTISDRGCQLVAASLTSMHHLSRLNLSFNQIGSRGITALMRALVGCESITYLGVSGNVMKIAGANAMGFALAQHPRLSELEVDNCCLSQVAQCHIAAGIISNRWVPMKRMNGFRVGPPLVAIGALDIGAQHLNNEECFRIRRDIQMKNILQWMKQKHNSEMKSDGSSDQILSSYFSRSDEVNDGAPSQSAYLRMLDWLSRIPFDEDELNDLRTYFFDVDAGDSGDGMRGSDGKLNLKNRGDLLAALGSKIIEEIRDTNPAIEIEDKEVKYIGLNLENPVDEESEFASEVFQSIKRLTQLQEVAHIPKEFESDEVGNLPNILEENGVVDDDDNDLDTNPSFGNNKKRKPSANFTLSTDGGSRSKDLVCNLPAGISSMSTGAQSSVSTLSQKSVYSRLESESNLSPDSENQSRQKARIALFPPFAAQLESLKALAQEYMDKEPDPMKQDFIAQKFAEESLTLLRQLRYHCMNNGLDGWRQGKIRRKVLVVDDSIVTRKLVQRAFEKANFIVDTAENGQIGVAKLKQCIYDIAFMDIDMPVMNGFDATKALRDWEDVNRPGARQPICALTAAYVDDFERSELMKFKDAGLDVMESKPCNIPRLFKVVDDVSPMFSDLSISVTHLDQST